MTSTSHPVYQGRCHCGAVRFEVDVEHPTELVYCNCSVCVRTRYIHLIVAKDKFRLLSDPAAITGYQFNTGTAVHSFCSTCGVKSYYVPRSHPDGYSVNARCLIDFDWEHMPVTTFDGRDYESNLERLQNDVVL